jgi:hypothetical protein
VVIRLVLGKLVKVVIKKVGGYGRKHGGCWVLWPLCVFGCISVAVVDGACVRDCMGLGLCIVGTVGYSVGHECVGGRDHV